MTLEKARPFQACEKPSAEQQASVATLPINRMLTVLERHVAMWQKRATSPGESLDAEFHRATLTNAIANKCRVGISTLTLYDAQQQGHPLSHLPQSIQDSIPHAREYALGAYASSMLLDTILCNVSVRVSSITKNPTSLILDSPAPGKADIPWAIHLGEEKADTYFETSDAANQWYKDESGLLLVERVTTAQPSDDIRFFMQTEGIPENFGELVTLYPHATAAAVFGPQKQ